MVALECKKEFMRQWSRLDRRAIEPSLNVLGKIGIFTIIQKALFVFTYLY
jgi:hypothetical protein